MKKFYTDFVPGFFWKSIYAVMALCFVFPAVGCEEGLKDGWSKTINAPKFTTDNPAMVVNVGGTLTSKCDIDAVIYSTDDEADIYYSLDGGSTWALYLMPIPITGNGSELHIIAYVNDEKHGESDRTEAAFAINYNRDDDPSDPADPFVLLNQVAPPELGVDNPIDTSYSNGTISCLLDMNIVMSTLTEGAVIYYSFDAGDTKTWWRYLEKFPIAGDGKDVTIYAKAEKTGMTDSEISSRRFQVAYARVAAPVMEVVYQQILSKESAYYWLIPGETVTKTRTLSNGESFDLSIFFAQTLTNYNGTNKVFNYYCTEEWHLYRASSVPYLRITSSTPGAEIFFEYCEYDLSDRTDNAHLFTNRALTRYFHELQLPDINGSYADGDVNDKAQYGTKYVVTAIAKKEGMSDSSTTVIVQVHGRGS
ncbi:MAG: hypothetical protein GY754_21075, partial [bacterium]|nr:hypothetical protein [bacterium]